MLSERGLQIVEKLIDNNRTPITSKKLAMYLGVSERSVKTYINEVSDFCKDKGIGLVRKPGIGFVADFTDEQIELVNSLKRTQKIVMSKQQRMSYISYILLSGWDTYTLSLFSEELNVSKNVIGDDMDSVAKKLEIYNIKINKVAGQGVFITGEEFDIRKALRGCCTFAIGTKDVEEIIDYRLTLSETDVLINNYGQDNVISAVGVVHKIEEKYEIVYTDYSFKMLVEYLTIQLYRVRMGNVIEKSIVENDNAEISPIAVEMAELLKTTKNVEITEAELEYIDILLAAASVQVKNEEYNIMISRRMPQTAQCAGKEMLEYLSKILSIDLTDNELLKTSLDAFLPGSFVRNKYDIEVINPFLNDIREMYSGIFATCFTLGKFYEQYCGKTATDHEISFLALFIGGAIHRNIKNVKAILIGTSGIAAANIVARKIEAGIEEVKIVAILSSEQVNEIDSYSYDIILSMLPNLKHSGNVVNISPMVSRADEKKIKDACFEVLSHPDLEKSKFLQLINEEYVEYVNEKVGKEEVLKKACDRLLAGGYVTEKFYDDVIKREKIEPTVIGTGVAIPHGTSQNVKKPLVFVMKLKNPVNWGSDLVDTIFLLALNFDQIEATKAFFAEFSRLLGTDSKLLKIRNSSSKEILIRNINEELKR